MSNIKLIVGLSNPGAEYQATRHNAGKWVVDELLRRYGASLKKEAKFFGETAELMINNQKVRVLVPTTYMNKSGQAVQALAHFYNIAPEEIMVIHDELALEPGQAKFKFAGGHNGHNGLRDIHRVMGDKYWRARVGIGHPGDKNKVAGYVLGKAPEADRKLLQEATDKTASGIEAVFKDGVEKVMNTFNM